MGSKRSTLQIKLVFSELYARVILCVTAEFTHWPSSLPQAQFQDVNDADLKAMDSQISELSAEVQSLTQSFRQLDAGAVHS